MGYDGVNQQTTQIDSFAGNPIATCIDGYDPVGNRVSRLQNNVSLAWTYDHNARLTGQQNQGGYATLAYDPTYNTIAKWYQGTNPLTMSYDPASRLTTSIQGTLVTTFGFDNAGFEILLNANGAVTTQAFDPENRLLSISSPAGLSSYTWQGYNGLRRSAFEPGKVLTTTVYDGPDYLQERS